jgi:1,4-dihydroxy-2-naphthoate octaprenyltransferase
MSSTFFALLQATRPWSFPVTVAPVLLGSAVALRASLPSSSSVAAPPVRLLSFLLALLGGLSVHCLGNLVNTLEDFRCGVDRADNGAHDRALVDHKVTQNQVRGLVVACVAVGAVCTLALGARVSNLVPSPSEHALGAQTSFLLLVLSGTFIAWAYTGWPLRLKYHRLGDVCILLAFGPLLSVGACFVQTGSLSSEAALLALPLGLLTEAVLHANNARDIRVDLAAGAHTLANSIGFQRSYTLFKALYVAAFASLPVFAALYRSPAFLLPAAMITQLGPLFATFLRNDPDGPARTKKTDVGDAQPASAASPAPAASTADTKTSPPSTAPGWDGDICDRCGQFSAGFGVLLALAVLVA